MSIPPPERISLITIWNSFLQVLNLEKGLLFTIKELAVRPGEMIRNYLFTNQRYEYAKPFSFLLLLTAIGTLLTVKILAYTQTQTAAQMGQFPDSMQPYLQNAMNLLGEYYNLYQVSQLPIFALATYWLFRSVKYNYAEHLIIHCYWMGFTTLIFVLVFPTFFISKTLMARVSLLSIVYQVYFYYKVFQNRFLISLGKSVLTYFIVSMFHGVLTILFLLTYFYLFVN